MSDGAPGRPPFEPTPDQRTLVQVLRANGTPVKTIAKALKIDRGTLNKHFRAELDSGKMIVKSMLGAVIIRAGMNGDWRAALAWLARFGGPEWATPEGMRRGRDDEAPPLGNTTFIIRGGLPQPDDGEMTISTEGAEAHFSVRRSNGAGNGADHSH
jgi:hypothetical protein